MIYEDVVAALTIGLDSTKSNDNGQTVVTNDVQRSFTL